MIEALPAGTATVILGLASAVAWGAGDFGGGAMSRRTSVFGVVLVSLGVGTVGAIALAIAQVEPLPDPADLGWSAIGGLVAGIGILSLYRGLAIGRMGVVAPVTGVLAASIPVVAGMILEVVPDPLVLVGIAIAIVAVVLVSRVRDPQGGPSGLPEALVAGVALGSFAVVIAQVTEGVVFGPLALVRITEMAVVGAIVIVRRDDWRPAARYIPILIAVGLLDMSGNAAYILAVQTGALAVAGVLSALYPVVTVILAAVILRERITRDHATGIFLAVVAIMCIGVGSA